MKKSPGKRGRERRAVSLILPALAQGRADTNIGALQGVTERLLTADAGRCPSLGAVLQSLFQFLHVPRCPPLCLPLRDERDEQPADPVTPKVELVRDARPATVVKRLDGASVFSSDGAVKAANTKLRGGSSSANSTVMFTSRRPMRRVTTARVPTATGPSPILSARTTPPCHSGRCEGSVTYANTSSGLREISMLATMGAIACLLPGDETSMIPHLGTARYERPQRRPPASRKGIARSRIRAGWEPDRCQRRRKALQTRL